MNEKYTYKELTMAGGAAGGERDSRRVEGTTASPNSQFLRVKYLE